MLEYLKKWKRHRKHVLENNPHKTTIGGFSWSCQKCGVWFDTTTQPPRCIHPNNYGGKCKPGARCSWGALPDHDVAPEPTKSDRLNKARKQLKALKKQPRSIDAYTLGIATALEDIQCGDLVEVVIPCKRGYFHMLALKATTKEE